MTGDNQIRPFRIDIPERDLLELRARLTGARLPEQPRDTSWERGMPRQFLADLAGYWATEFDWRAQEAKLNAYPQFTTEIDGQTIHFVHVRSAEPGAIPLILGHGYPGSFVDFFELIGPLTDPRAHGGDPADAFDVVIPSIPGFGFSVPVSEPGWQQQRAAGAFTQLMGRLGYERYGAHGYDIGSGIVGDMPRFAPQAMIGSHIATDVHAFAYLGFLPGSGDDMPDEERAYLDRLRADAEGGTGYLKLTSTRPQTVAYAVTDSPVFQLAWIVEKFKEWTHPSKALPEDAISRDTLLTNVSLYWFTRSGASAAHFLYNSMNAAQDWSPGPAIPTAFSVFGGDPFGIVSAALNPGGANPNWFEHDVGGHFPSLEEPDLLVADLRTSFRGLLA
jgi:pimeloyl-ACP methyl ester carboxylesterase